MQINSKRANLFYRKILGIACNLQRNFAARFLKHPFDRWISWFCTQRKIYLLEARHIPLFTRLSFIWGLYFPHSMFKRCVFFSNSRNYYLENLTFTKVNVPAILSKYAREKRVPPWTWAVKVNTELVSGIDQEKITSKSLQEMIDRWKSERNQSHFFNWYSLVKNHISILKTK